MVLFMPITIRLLGPDRVGVLSLIWALVAWFAFMDLGLGRAVTQAISGDVNQGRVAVARTFWSAVAMQASAGLVASVVLLFVGSIYLNQIRMSPSLHNEAKTAMYLVCASLPITFMMGSCIGVLQAANRFDLTSWVTACLGIANSAIPALAAYVAPSLITICAVIVLTRAGAAIASFSLCRVAYSSERWGVDVRKETCRRLIRFGGWLSVSSVVGPLLTYGDRFVIGLLLPVSAVTYYSVPYDGAMRVLLISGSVAAVAFPKLAKTWALKDGQFGMVICRGTVVLVSAMGIALVVVAAFGHDLMTLWLGRQFADASGPVLPVLCAGLAINAAAVLPAVALQAAGRPDITATLHLVEVLPHAAMLAVLTWRFGIAGTAVAWTIRVSVDATLLWWATVRHIGVKTSVPTRQVAPRVFAMLALGTIGLAVSFCNVTLRMYFGGALVLGTVGIAWILLDPVDRSLIRAIVRH